MDYDLIVVVGGGAAGLGAARTAAQRGARTLLVSDGEPGGDCTFSGCVPSKTLVESARQGLSFAAATRRVRDAVAEIAATENAATLRAEGIEVMLGRATFTGPGRITVDGQAVSGRRFVVATGSGPAIPPVPGLDQVPYLTNESVFDLAELPDSLAVLGGGAVGCELAQAFARLGSKVTVVEALDRLLPREEPEASAVVAAVFAREGVDVRAGTQVEKIAAGGPGVRLLLADGQAVHADQLLVAVGRRPVTDGLNLPAAGAGVDEHGHVVTDRRLAAAPGVYAAGDVTGLLPFTHAAFAMGRVAAGNALSRRWRHVRDTPAGTPWVTFTDPEVARVGATEAEAAARGSRTCR